REWDVATGEERATIADAGVVIGLVPASKTLVTVATSFTGNSGSEIRLWDLESGRRGITISISRPAFRQAILSPDGTSIATCNSETATLWDTVAGTKVGRIAAADGRLFHESMSFSPDGKLLAGSTSNRTVAVWEVETGRQVAQDVNLDGAQTTAFSPD